MKQPDAICIGILKISSKKENGYILNDFVVSDSNVEYYNE